MIKRQVGRLWAGALVALTVMAAPGVQADDYPSRPIRIINPFPAGGTGDQVVRVVFEKHEEMMEVHAAAAATVPENLERNTFLPLHPGAIRYYQQIGKAGGTD